ncbi:cytochrome c [Candidatus Magnetaquicoccus inordinatus]|uniref:cytochrome c n=1 Tax=Candidatus Magnetaquicoccus inordinatus TaxID=2496818 RepID=UPI00187D2613|nr:cytochrome c [Candidatus Magnetaquicoccus inordinatus]
MSRRAGLLVTLLAMATGMSGAALASEREQYVQSVISLLRTHADTIRQLASQDFKYSRNLARHADALIHTFGLLGPMDWHAAEASFLHKKHGDSAHLQPADFDRLADQCQKSMRTLQTTSLQHVEHGGSAKPVLKALEDIQGKCTGCHDLLDGAAPDVWGKHGKK